MSTPSVVMGDPSYFAIKSGPNPHTRFWWGGLKQVDRNLAIQQWGNFKALLETHGVRVCVIAPDSELPGLVYPANAGILFNGVFHPSNLLPARAKERPKYEAFFKGLGYSVQGASFRQHRFEGEAEFFPWGNRYIFTYGKIEPQRFVPAWKFPFYKRVYGFRSDLSALSELQGIVQGGPIVELQLVDERYYHGDTCICSFGPRREYLMVYLPALAPDSQRRIKELAGDRLIPLSDADAACYAANAYPAVLGGVPHLFMTVSASSELKRRVTALGVRLVEVEVSEFLKKGGGSVKCMVFDLGQS